MKLLSQQTVAEKLGVSGARVRMLDTELGAIRLDGGQGPRVYVEERVNAFAAERRKRNR